MCVIMFNNSYKIYLNFYETFMNFSFNKELRYIHFSILHCLYMRYFIHDEMDKRNDFPTIELLVVIYIYIINF